MATRISLLALLFASLAAWGAEVAGIRFDDKAKVGEAELSLTGAGLRKRLFFQVYAIGLYVHVEGERCVARQAHLDPVATGRQAQ